MRGPRTAMKSGPRLPQLEKALVQKRRPNTAKNKKINKIKKKKTKGIFWPTTLQRPSRALNSEQSTTVIWPITEDKRRGGGGGEEKRESMALLIGKETRGLLGALEAPQKPWHLAPRSNSRDEKRARFRTCCRSGCPP